MKLPNMSKVTGLVNIGKQVLSTYRPEILLGTSITTTIAAVVMAAKGGYESGQQVLREEYTDLDLINPEGKTRELDVKEKIQLTWTNYLPAAGLTVGALGSTTALHLVHVKDKRAMASAALAAADEVKRNIIKTTEEETTKMLEERADENGVARVENGDGVIEELYLVRDGRSGRDIWSNSTRIEEAINQVNRVLARQGDCELNTFYGAAGFELLFPEGDDWGWSGDFVELVWSNTVKDDGRPVRKFDFRKPPTDCTDR